MKISRLHINNFAREEFQKIERDNIAGDDFLIVGGNRSGKTLSFNAFLYGLYGPRSTFGVAPGRRSEVNIVFDNGHELFRGGGGREYRIGRETFSKDEADQRILENIGPQKLVSLGFIHSEPDELPLANLSGEDRISLIRSVVDSDVQSEIEELREHVENLDLEIERTERTELKPRKEELDDIELSRFENRLDEIRTVKSLLDSGRLAEIRDTLLADEEIRDSLESLDKEQRSLQQQIRKVKRKLSEERHYTQQVREIIIEAISELTCPVCDEIVREEKARNRYNSGMCPQCGRKRDLDDLEADLQERVDTADDHIEKLEDELDSLKTEREQILNEIQDLRNSKPNLGDLNNLATQTLRSHDYDLSEVKETTDQELEKHRSTVDELRSRKGVLEAEVAKLNEQLGSMEQDLAESKEEIERLEDESFREIVETFRSHWAECYENFAPELAVDIRLERDGNIILPGNEGPREYSELSTGERRMLNISFAYAMISKAIENQEHAYDFECLVLDEPFANIDDKIRREALSYMRDSEIQFIITSSNVDLIEEFDPPRVKELETIPVQYTLAELEERES